MECVVEFNYDAQEDDELTLKKGEIITNVTQKTDGWWEGTLHNKTGMFPDNFVKLIDKSTSKTTPSDSKSISTKSDNVILRSNSNKSIRRLKALFSYSPEQEDELRLEVGDIIEYIEEVEEGWWRGNLKGKVGIFPSNFVSDSSVASTTNGESEAVPKINDLSSSTPSKASVPDVVPPAPPSEPPPMDDDDDEPPILPPKPVREQARCFYAYQAQNEDELTLNDGDIVTIISKTCDDEGWWRGELRGRTGLFPDNFVKIITSEVPSTNKSSHLSAALGPKISPQERTNLVGVRPMNVSGVDRSGSGASDKKSKSNGTHDGLDGIGFSMLRNKPANDQEQESVSSKVKRFSKLNLTPGGKPPSPVTSPVSFTTPAAAMHSSNSNAKKEPSKDADDGEFNSIEIGEKLSHLTATRAKAPRRRPPSTGITKEDGENGLNGSYDSIESPSINHSTPLNVSLNTTQNHTASLHDSLNISENNSIDIPSGGSSINKPKTALPWMTELKEKQDKKQGLNTSSNVTNPNVTSPATLSKEKEPGTLPVKAPPLPAKPTSLVANNTASLDKGPLIGSNITSNTPIVTNRVLGKKPPAPTHPATVNNIAPVPEGMIGGTGDPKNFVSYEEYAKLRDKVGILESELETIRRQVKLLLDVRQSHIV